MEQQDQTAGTPKAPNLRYSYLVGFGFVLFYTVLGLPFGAAADRTNRRNLIVMGLVGWSLATAGSGLVGGFGGLLAMRALVGVGEAALSPAALSTIADRFPPERPGFAISLYSSGIIRRVSCSAGGPAMGFGGMIAPMRSHARAFATIFLGFGCPVMAG